MTRQQPQQQQNPQVHTLPLPPPPPHPHPHHPLQQATPSPLLNQVPVITQTQTTLSFGIIQHMYSNNNNNNYRLTQHQLNKLNNLTQ